MSDNRAIDYAALGEAMHEWRTTIYGLVGDLQPYFREHPEMDDHFDVIYERAEVFITLETAACLQYRPRPLPAEKLAYHRPVYDYFFPADEQAAAALGQIIPLPRRQMEILRICRANLANADSGMRFPLAYYRALDGVTGLLSAKLHTIKRKAAARARRTAAQAAAAAAAAAARASRPKSTSTSSRHRLHVPGSRTRGSRHTVHNKQERTRT